MPSGTGNKHSPSWSSIEAIAGSGKLSTSADQNGFHNAALGAHQILAYDGRATGNADRDASHADAEVPMRTEVFLPGLQVLVTAMTTPNPVPPDERAKQIPPPTGAVQRALVWAFGPSYRTTLASIVTGISGTAAGIVALWPQLANGPITTRKVVFIGLSVVAGGGLTKLGASAKDKSVTGVEK